MVNNIATILLYVYVVPLILSLLLTAIMSLRKRHNPSVTLLADYSARVLSCLWFSILWPIMLRDIISSAIKLRKTNVSR